MSEKGRVGSAYFKALFKQEFFKAFIPCFWCLLKPIERLLVFVDIDGKLVIFKAQWLLNIDKFLNRAIKKCTLHIHLI